MATDAPTAVTMPVRKKPTVRRTRQLSGGLFTFLLGAGDDTLQEFAAGSMSRRAAKTLVKQSGSASAQDFSAE